MYVFYLVLALAWFGIGASYMIFDGDSASGLICLALSAISMIQADLQTIKSRLRE